MNMPALVELDAHTLVMHWRDAEPQRIAHYVLREACPCAGCRLLRRGADELNVPHDVVVCEIRPMGYGLQLIFSDGHDRGIFPWPYLALLPGGFEGEAHTFPDQASIQPNANSAKS